MSIQKYLATSNLEEYIQELVSWCHKEAAKLEKHQARYPAMVAAAEMAEDKLRIPGQNLDVLTQYQTTLDNQLYKTLKNLREAPEWRIRAIDAGSEPVNQDVSVDAA